MLTCHIWHDFIFLKLISVLLWYIVFRVAALLIVWYFTRLANYILGSCNQYCVAIYMNHCPDLWKMSTLYLAILGNISSWSLHFNFISKRDLMGFDLFACLLDICMNRIFLFRGLWLYPRSSSTSCVWWTPTLMDAQRLCSPLQQLRCVQYFLAYVDYLFN